MKNYISNRICAFFAASLLAPFACAENVSLANGPLSVGTDVPPMVMLVLSRDHTLYYEAYNDASDLNDDGQLDVGYKPATIDYAGYFDSYKCYSYSSDLFTPAATTTNKACSDSNHWSGDFLNYLTMARIDVLRQVLYGGMRKVDTGSDTVLERTFIPQDAHSWGKQYSSVAVDGYDISQYTPFSLPASGGKHFFGTASFSDGGKPEIRIRLNQQAKSGKTCDIWDWASTERPVLADDPNSNYNCTPEGSSDSHYTVRVKVCVAGLLEQNCQEYPDGNYKPTGLLHEFGESDGMEFGLLSGSFANNLSGGVLRHVVDNFANEVDSDSGVFDTSANGIVKTIDALRIQGFSYSSDSYDSNCGWKTQGPISNGECNSWGNPIGEMLYESTRYFHDQGTASASFSTGTEYGLPVDSWDKPFDVREYCARPNNLVIGDIYPSYDADQLPGPIASGNTYSGSTLTGFDAKALVADVSSQEGISGNYFIGYSESDAGLGVGAPTAKIVTNLNNIYGLAPQEPTKLGSYSAAGVAYYGRKTDLFPAKDGHQSILTSVVAISSPLPEIDIAIDDQTIRLVPYAKSVNGFSIEPGVDKFQPTNTIVDYYVENITNTSGVFRINFEDVEQGADHDMDMIVTYSYEVFDDLCPIAGQSCLDSEKAKGVKVTLSSDYAAGSIEQHAGYVISGTSQDGIYLDVRDQGDANATDYYLDTVSSADLPYPNNLRTIGNSTERATDLIIGVRSRHFFPQASSRAAEFLPSPLYYAAKYGGFVESDEVGNDNLKPDLVEEWDDDGDGIPDSYFPVTNAGELADNLRKAFENIANQDSAGTSQFSNRFLTAGSVRYQSSYSTDKWSGDVKAYEVDATGEFSTTEKWSVAKELDERDIVVDSVRRIFTRNDESGTVFRFKVPTPDGVTIAGKNNRWSQAQILHLLDGFSGTDAEKTAYAEAVINYIGGDRSHESPSSAYDLRVRESRLGDVINSSPYVVDTVNGHSVNKPVIVFGANDGMVHVVRTSNGKELGAYMPSQVYQHLGSFVKNSYAHNFTVDGAISGFTDTTANTTTVVGTLGHGIKGLYALQFDNSDVKVNKDAIKWEITATGDFADLGYTGAQPTIATLENGQTGVIFPNGFNAGGDGAIYIANVTDGSLIAKLSVGAQTDPTGNSRPNALAEPAVLDTNGDGVADRIYAGDLYGNMWSFDITDSDPGNWKVATNDLKPLFTATSPSTSDGTNVISQSITSRPSFAVHQHGLSDGIMVSFGTGLYVGYGDASATNQPTQTFYSIWDKLDGSRIDDSRSGTDKTYNKLMQQKITKEVDEQRSLTQSVIDWTTDFGFYIDLINTENNNTNNRGERQVTTSLSLIDTVSFTTLAPNDDPCSGGGDGWYMELNLHNGLLKNSYQFKYIPPAPTVIMEPPYDAGSPPDNVDPDDPTPVCQVDCEAKKRIYVGDKYFEDTTPPVGMLNWRRMY
ncbi:pilus assembly protein [Ferrimonas lipolytica]|uniref:Fimbrial assembly protein n=1 Tax=Ferrimonas lipolytica TaxID=2724191 RepID=A0A6H1UDG3_9GAMM|nr:PilC/PilY family type IV pilus protein [Ferrimonas lipolytica]QIZ77125.1 fimbrial assembly protein [Ferrimonas lipolytica]